MSVIIFCATPVLACELGQSDLKICKSSGIVQTWNFRTRSKLKPQIWLRSLHFWSPRRKRCTMRKECDLPYLTVDFRLNCSKSRLYLNGQSMACNEAVVDEEVVDEGVVGANVPLAAAAATLSFNSVICFFRASISIAISPALLTVTSPWGIK